MFNKSGVTGNVIINLHAIVRGTLFALVIALGLTLLAGILFHVTNLSQSWAHGVASLIFALSIFIGGIIAARKAGHNGLFHGLGVGILFLVLSLLLTILSVPGNIIMGLFAKKTIYSAIAGSLGGILGVGNK